MNRGYETNGKQPRRLRLWLKPETWAFIDKLAGEQAWHQRRDQYVVEMLLDMSAKRDREAALLVQSSSSGPIELDPWQATDTAEQARADSDRGEAAMVSINRQVFAHTTTEDLYYELHSYEAEIAVRRALLAAYPGTFEQTDMIARAIQRRSAAANQIAAELRARGETVDWWED